MQNIAQSSKTHPHGTFAFPWDFAIFVGDMTTQAEEKRNPQRGRSRTRVKEGAARRAPLVSIVTICYNAEEEIAVTAASVASQSFGDYEHVVVDGASTDSTIARARLNGGRRMRIVSEPDNGLYDAMNKGLAMARGKYVLFLNAGDAFHSPHTLKSYARAIADTQPDIIYADTVIVDSSRKFLRPRHLSAPDFLTVRSFSRGMLICHQAFMVRKEIAPKYDLGYRFSADYDWCLKCIRASRPGRRVNLREVAIDYLDNGLTVRNRPASLWERFRIMKKNFGLVRTLAAHFGFVPRAVARKFLGR